MRFVTLAEALSLIPDPVGMKVRYRFYRKFLKSLGTNVEFQFGCVLSYKDIEIGDNVGIGLRSRIGFAKIGSNVMIGQNVIVLSGSLHYGFFRTDKPMYFQRDFTGRRRVEIGDDVFIGSGSIIMANVPKGCVIRAGSVIHKKFSEYDIIEGNPARAIFNRLTRKKQ
jgi:acetyltransferase-like isoleucine patch superfamily enzyme